MKEQLEQMVIFNTLSEFVNKVLPIGLTCSSSSFKLAQLEQVIETECLADRAEPNCFWPTGAAFPLHSKDTDTLGEVNGVW